jgi:hypothetical protein
MGKSKQTTASEENGDSSQPSRGLHSQPISLLSHGLKILLYHTRINGFEREVKNKIPLTYAEIYIEILSLTLTQCQLNLFIPLYFLI